MIEKIKHNNVKVTLDIEITKRKRQEHIEESLRKLSLLKEKELVLLINKG